MSYWNQKSFHCRQKFTNTDILNLFHCCIWLKVSNLSWSLTQILWGFKSMFFHISKKESCKAPVKQINHLKQSGWAGPVRYRFELLPSILWNMRWGNTKKNWLNQDRILSCHLQPLLSLMRVWRRIMDFVAAVAYLLQGLICCAFRDTLLCVLVVIWVIVALLPWSNLLWPLTWTTNLYPLLVIRYSRFFIILCKP